jgi:uncharacterized tellurite resistance protein B-like protein
MDTITFDKLLLKTAFCCLACDGNIDSREVDLLKSVFSTNPLYSDSNFEEKLNAFIQKYNEKGKEFFGFYFDLLNQYDLSEQEELMIIDIAIKTIKADEEIQYAEVKFFKSIRSKLKVSDEVILNAYPDIDNFLEDDISIETTLSNITDKYFEIADLPKFDLISIDTTLLTGNNNHE